MSLASAFALAMASLSPIPVLGVATAAAFAPPENDPALDQARDLYERGRAKFETYDYAGAVELWTEAYARLDESPRNREIRNNLVYNIATAQERAYELDNDIAHLRQAKALLEKYVGEYKTLYKETPEGQQEIAKVDQRIAEIQQRIDQAGAGTPTPPPPVVDPAAQQRNELRAKQQEVKILLRSDPDISPRYRGGKSMLGGGIALTVVGGIASLFFFGLGAESRGWKIAGGVVGSVGVATLGGGIALTVLGARKKRDAQQDAWERVGITPTASRGFTVRF